MESWNNESGFIDFIAYSYNKTFYFYMRKKKAILKKECL